MGSFTHNLRRVGNWQETIRKSLVQAQEDIMHITGLSSIKSVLSKEKAAYPLWVCCAFSVSMGTGFLYRSFTKNPDVRFLGGKHDSLSGDAVEGEHYKYHPFRKFIRSHLPQTVQQANSSLDNSRESQHLVKEHKF